MRGKGKGGERGEQQQMMNSLLGVPPFHAWKEEEEKKERIKMRRKVSEKHCVSFKDIQPDFLLPFCLRFPFTNLSPCSRFCVSLRLLLPPLPEGSIHTLIDLADTIRISLTVERKGGERGERFGDNKRMIPPAPPPLSQTPHK